MTDVSRGRLEPASAAPPTGEITHVVARLGTVDVEQILSGRVSEPVDYLQDHDEWVAVLEGAAELDLDGDRLPLTVGDWVVLPAGRPHRLLSTEPGTTWLAVHGPPVGDMAAGTCLVVRRERGDDVEPIRRVHATAFPCADGEDEPVEVRLVEGLRGSVEWLPALSLVAEVDGEVVGHVVCSRARLGEPPGPALGLGPLAVRPDRQGIGIGSALMRAVIGAADALDEALVVLLGSPDYYGRFGFRAASDLGIEAPDPAWSVHFQALPLTAYRPSQRGPFRYAPAFDVP